MHDVRSRSSGKNSLALVGGCGASASTGMSVDIGSVSAGGAASIACAVAGADANMMSIAVSAHNVRLNFSFRPGRLDGATALRFTVLSQSQQTPRATVLVVDFGAQYAQLIARRVRELHVFSEIVGHRLSAAEMAAKNPAAIILSGGPKSVHVEGAPSLDPAVYDLGIPILASATAHSSSRSSSAEPSVAA